MRNSISAAVAATLATSSAFAHDSVVAHAHPHGSDALIAMAGLAALGGLLWYLGLPPFEKKTVREVEQHRHKK